MPGIVRIVLISLFIAVLQSCGDYTKNNSTAASVRADERKEAMEKLHPGLDTIEIVGMLFQPAKLKINKGDTVVWVNRDMLAHDVTEEKNRSWSSGRLESGATWQKVMNESVDYFCSLHVVMKGKIIVQSGKAYSDN